MKYVAYAAAALSLAAAPIAAQTTQDDSAGTAAPSPAVAQTSASGEIAGTIGALAAIGAAAVIAATGGNDNTPDGGSGGGTAPPVTTTPPTATTTATATSPN
jgi:hypothetical protein